MKTSSQNNFSFLCVIFVIALVALILSILAFVSDNKSGRKSWSFSDNKDGERQGISGERQGCWPGGTGCSKYTEEAIKHMEKEGRSVEMEMTGIVVDMRCYSQNLENWTDRHVTAIGDYMDGCGRACAKMGLPVGLLEITETGQPKVGGKVYVLLSPSIQLALAGV